MIITLENTLGSTPYNVDILPSYKNQYIQSVKFVRTMSGKTIAIDRGATADKWRSSFVIQGLKSDIFDLSAEFRKHKNQITIQREAQELIFGAGIDYTYPIVCNSTSSDIRYPQNNLALAEIELSVEALSSNGAQLKYKSSIIAALPDLNYQTPVVRKILRSETPFSSIKYGDFGMTNIVNASGAPAYAYEMDLKFSQNELETAGFEKVYSQQRAIPFAWPALDCLDLWEDQTTENIMITSFSSAYVNQDNWNVNLKFVTNV